MNLDIGQLSRKYHGIYGEQPISVYPYVDDPSIMMVEAFHETGLPILDYNGACQLGTMNSQAMTADGRRVSANDAFIQPIRYRRKNLTVRIKSDVFKILINDKKIAYGVRYERKGKVYAAYARKEVIVSAGSIDAPKLLMLSGVGPKEHLSQLNISVIQDLAVGENLHDHVTFNGILIALNRSSTLINQKAILDEVCKYKETKWTHGPLSGNGPNNAMAFIKTEPDLPAPDIQIQIAHIYLNEYVRGVALADSLPIFPTSFYDGMLVRAMNLVPKSRGNLLLNATNPRGPPLLYANYLGDPADITPIIKGYRYLFTLDNTKALKSRGAYIVKTPLEPCTDFAWGSDEYLNCLARAYTSATHHQVGTCKMGPRSDEKAVVDSRLRVYGISGLRVIDASIMPFVIRGNTYAPSMLIGERGVAFVIEEWLNKNKRTYYNGYRRRY